MASDTEYYRRTAITRLDGLSQHDHELLRATTQGWLDRCNTASSLAWENEHTRSGVRNTAKDTVQGETNLGSQHSILACHEVAAAPNPVLKNERKQEGNATTLYIIFYNL
ncbi:hypothetical protein [Haloquadratum walsbyi]|jgi:hypothetical protein|uniref:Transposase n=1 Tax=Haloquadratum walsbyi J07HQW2 TaxID=1238425 RepID=U1PP45_9EURY|nr:hypothetical protein [Haloquadratum walsbyi]ERG95512.1 MAG: hypothetical protein J07HQW2_01969 [Haloquadratum walsbyi J07HQW2]